VVSRPRLDRELERYLVDGETVIVSVRLHWFHLSRELLTALAATVVAFWVDLKVTRSPGGELIQNASLLFWWGAALWLLWSVLNWRRDRFVATDKRLLLFYGFIRRRVAMMPLAKVTDMTYDRSLLGRIVGYGKFMLESAGQDQALSVVDHVPDADRHYRAICTQLFGPGAQVRSTPRGFGPPPVQPPDDGGPGGGGSGGGRGGGPYPGGPDSGGRDSGGPNAGGRDAGGRDAGDAHRDPGPADGRDRPSPVRTPESWYRSSNLSGPAHLGDTGEIPVVRVPRDDEDAPLYPPPHWSEQD